MNQPYTISSIVEGHGDAAALPPLLRRIAGEIFNVYNVRITPPHRVPRAAMKSDNLRKAIQLQSLMTESYRETLHQPAFASLMDLAEARRARSFDRLVNCVGRILNNRAE